MRFKQPTDQTSLERQQTPFLSPPPITHPVVLGTFKLLPATTTQVLIKRPP
jgi:hypothetical protein